MLIPPAPTVGLEAAMPPELDPWHCQMHCLVASPLLLDWLLSLLPRTPPLWGPFPGTDDAQHPFCLLD